MATTVTITYDDGHQDVVKLLPLGLVRAERHFGKAALPRIEGTLYAAWSLLNPGGKFDEWLATIVDAEEQVEESPGPSAEAASPGP